MDLLKPFKRIKFMDKFIVSFRDVIKKHSTEKDAQLYKRDMISVLVVELEDYEKELYGKTVIPSYWRNRFVEQLVDEYMLEHNQFSQIEVDNFLKRMLNRYDLVVDMWMDIENKLKGDD